MIYNIHAPTIVIINKVRNIGIKQTGREILEAKILKSNIIPEINTLVIPNTPRQTIPKMMPNIT